MWDHGVQMDQWLDWKGIRKKERNENFWEQATTTKLDRGFPVIGLYSYSKDWVESWTAH